MKLPLFALIAAAFASAPCACDPDLTVHKSASDAASDGPRNDAPDTTEIDASTEDGATEDADTDSGVKHVIDGINDFATGDKLPTTSSANGYDAYVTWDDKRISFGMSGPDVGANSSTKWVLVYLEGTPGSTVGENY